MFTLNCVTGGGGRGYREDLVIASLLSGVLVGKQIALVGANVLL